VNKEKNDVSEEGRKTNIAYIDFGTPESQFPSSPPLPVSFLFSLLSRYLV
jgi:hypothetical protein